MMVRSRHGVAAVLTLVPAMLAAQQSGRAFQPSDWYRVAQLSTPALSPDGSQVAFTVTTVQEAANKRHQEIWLQAVAGGPARRLTSPGFESSTPRWSPDGKTLYFTSSRPGGRGTEWALRVDELGEAFQPTSPAPSAAPAGSEPKDRRFRVTSGDSASAGGRGAGGRGGRGGGAAAPAAPGPFAAMPPMARPSPAAITTPVDPARFDGMHITDTRYKANGNGFVPSTGRGGSGDSAATPAAATRGAAQLYLQRTGGERVALTSTAYSHRSPVVSPDGEWIVFLADVSLRADSVVTRERDSLAKLPFSRKRDEADRNTTDLYLLPVAACEARTAACVPRRIAHAGDESGATWSPDSKQLAFVARKGAYQSNRLFVVPVVGGKPRDVLGAWRYEPGTITWWDNGTIRMQTETGGNNGVHAVDVATGAVTTVLGGRRRIAGLQVDTARTTMVFVATDHAHPTELFATDIDGGNERKLTSFNEAVNRDVAWSDAEHFAYRSVDNLEIDGWLMKPFGYQPGKRYPVVVYIHGGPHSAYGDGWFDEFQNLAGAGMFVLFTNPRGSTGTNGAFTHASRGDWGGKDYLDIMKAVDIVAQRADVDSTRVGVTGGSYGGFMTAWITTKSNRFKAAQADRMISDWNAWWGTSDVQSLTNNEFFGKPWENQAMYDTLSPIRFVQRVKTPTLIVQSEEDHRTPMATAEMWFMALKTLGVPAEFVRYPRSTHDLSRTGEPWLLVDRLGRLRQWFGHWLAEGGPPTKAPQAGAR